LKLIFETNFFKLYFRKNVSFSNLEGKNQTNIYVCKYKLLKLSVLGQEWCKISLPDNKLVISCSCSCKGDLWCVTYEGDVLVRTHISRENPMGLDWIILDQSSKETNNMKMISIGKDSVWALDNLGRVFYRVGISLPGLPQGLKIVTLPSSQPL
jgi:hypothetical protein